MIRHALRVLLIPAGLAAAASGAVLLKPCLPAVCEEEEEKRDRDKDASRAVEVRGVFVREGVAPAASPLTSERGDEVEVRAALHYYLAGLATGNGEHFRRVFHPDARLYSVRDGRLTQRTVAEYVAGAPGRPAADEAKRRRWLERLSVAGSAATAEIVLDYPDTRVIDYVSLLRVDGEWKIISKTFHAEPKPARR